MTADVVKMHTIHRVMNEFLQWRAPSLDSEALSIYQACLGCFEQSIDAHAPRALDAAERDVYRRDYVQGRGYRRPFSEVFGPEKIPREIRYFLSRFLGNAVAADIEVLEQAPSIVADLCSWLEWKGYIPESEMEAAIDELGALVLGEQQDSVNV